MGMSVGPKHMALYIVVSSAVMAAVGAIGCLPECQPNNCTPTFRQINGSYGYLDWSHIYDKQADQKEDCNVKYTILKQGELLAEQDDKAHGAEVALHPCRETKMQVTLTSDDEILELESITAKTTLPMKFLQDPVFHTDYARGWRSVVKVRSGLIRGELEEVFEEPECVQLQKTQLFLMDSSGEWQMLDEKFNQTNILFNFTLDNFCGENKFKLKVFDATSELESDLHLCPVWRPIHTRRMMHCLCKEIERTLLLQRMRRTFL